MAGGIHKLRPRTIETVKKVGLLSDGGGLYLSVSKTGSKSWAYIWIKNGKRRQMGLGGLISVSVVEARAKADAARRLVAEGKDPIKERDGKIEKTFKECADALVSSLSPSWQSGKSLEQWTRTINHFCAPLLSMDVAEIETADVLEVLKPIWSTKPETARRVRSRIARVIDYAVSHRWRNGDNPARWKYHLQNLLPPQGKRGNFAALPIKSIPSLMVELREKQTMSAMALEFTILTAARTGETLGADWSEIDFQEKLWIVPAERMKGRVKHEVPLTARAMELLQQLHETNHTGFIFFGRRRDKPMSNMTMAKTLKGLTEEACTVHGMRSTFRDYCGDMTNFPREVAEAALAHKVGNSAELSYRRGNALEKRRQLMRLWNDYCDGKTSADVVQLHVG